MTEKELLNKIKESANHVEIPNAVKPESVAKHLAHRTSAPRTLHFSLQKTASIAAVFLLFAILSFVAWNSRIVPQMTESIADETMPHETVMAERNEEAESETDKAAPKQDAGTLYTVAKSYDDVTKILESYAAYYNGVDASMGGIAIAENFDITEGADESSAEAAGADDAAFSLLNSQMARKEAAVEEETGAEEYSTTNLQTEGVDESDIVKTDGRYIYTVNAQKIIITDTAENSLTPAGSIRPELDAADSILELYVDDDALILIVQHYDTGFTESGEAAAKRAYADSEDVSYDMAFVNPDCSTVLYVYDITDPTAPVLKGTSTQDGYYQTSRKIGDLVYLFTRKGDLAYETAYKDAKGGFIPCVNGKEIPYDHIYLPERGDSGLILSSFHIENPSEAVDEIMIIHDYAEVYVGNNSIYLYQENYQNEDTLTQIAKFSMENGMLNAVNATAVKGEIYDTFAINESENRLRVLTTSYERDGMSDNHLYLLDENLALTGSLSGIARGEQIYAARYFGDTAYFITYRNTDPLFAVDLSDRSNPKLLGELEITGFSEYLHFWEDDKLLGIGYETDPDSGLTKGLKLVMFDISNPVALKTIDSLVLKDYSYSPSLYDYKCILAHPGKNLIGFLAEHYADEDGSQFYLDYLVYAFENGKFVNKLAERMPEDSYTYSTRGLFIGDTFFTADPSEIRSFDMKNQFSKLANLSLENE